jgi:CHASE2 domain-containing sensor protein
MAASTREEVAGLLQKLPYAQANAIKFDLIRVGPMMSLIWLLDDGLVHGP